ncbi:MAG: SBBP repeat-containing protein [Bacteroidetes bacterium]|nr:SBBP repeat-containing protein [Bacteroidota bacterium]
MNKIYILVLSIICVISNISAQNNKNTEKYMSTKTQYGFIENKGQIYDQNYKANPDVKYLLSLGNGMNVQLKKNSFSYDTYKKDSKEINNKPSVAKPQHTKKVIGENNEITYYFHRVDVELVDANSNPEIIAEDVSAEYINYYNAVAPECGVTKVRNYRKIIYKNIYPGIDMIFVAVSGKEKAVEYYFEVHPSADAKLIQLHYTGADQTRLIENKICVKVAHGSFTESIPASWIKETNTKVEICYKNTAKDTYTFTIPAYTNKQTLIIDPNPNLDWGTYYGGTDVDNGEKNCCDKFNNVYVTGITRSLNAIATSGAHQTTHGGSSYDAFVLKLDNNGVRQWCTYYGGSGDDKGREISCDSSGNVFIVGETTTSSGDAIATSTAHQYLYGGGTSDAFIAKFNSGGVRLWGSYYGGSDADYGFGIACDKTGNVYFTGKTQSSVGIATTASFQPGYGSGGDAFIAKFNGNGVRQWASYYGGSGEDMGEGIACDSSGNVFICGLTISTTAIASPGAFETIYDGSATAGQYNGFVAKFNAVGTRLWGTYAGRYESELYGICCDNNGNAYVTGFTFASTGIATPGAYQSILVYPNTNCSAYILKFNSGGNRIWGTYYGAVVYPSNPTFTETYSNEIACDLKGNIYITGGTDLFDSIATSGTYQSVNSGYDAFLAKFDTNGVIKWGTYYGGNNGNEESFGVACNTNGNVFITGYTASTNSISTTGTAQPTYGGNYDVFVARFSTCDTLPLSAGMISGMAAVCQGQTSVTYTLAPVTNATSYIWTLPSGANGSGNSNTITVNYGTSALSGNISVKGHNSCGDGATSTLTVTVNPLPLAGTISGTTTICSLPVNLTYSIPFISGASSCVWTLPGGVNGSSNTNTITVNYSSAAVSGNISVYGINSCGNGIPSTLAVTVGSVPPAPVITINGNTLNSNATNGNQWYNLSTGLIPGATASSYSPLQSGNYFTIVSINGCSSDSSNILYLNYIGVKEYKSTADGFNIYPNPAKDDLIFELKGNKVLQNTAVSIYNIQGQILKQLAVKESKTVIDIHNLANGVYIVKVNNERENFVSKFVKE